MVSQYGCAQIKAKPPQSFKLIGSSLGFSLYEKQSTPSGYGRITAQVLYLKQGAMLEPNLHFSNIGDLGKGRLVKLEHYTVKQIYDQQKKLTAGLLSVINGVEFSSYDEQANNNDCYVFYITTGKKCDTTSTLTNGVYANKIFYKGEVGLRQDLNGMLLSLSYKDSVAKVHDLESLGFKFAKCGERNCFTKSHVEIINELNKIHKNVDHYIPGKFISLDETTWPNDKNKSNRTALGVIDSDGDGSGDAVVVLVAENITIVGLAEAFKYFNVIGTPCDEKFCTSLQVLMLDSGGSSQVYYDFSGGEPIYSSANRPIPMSIVISNTLKTSAIPLSK